MRGFEWKDQRGVEGIGFVRALRSLMTAQLPKLLPSLRYTLENEVAAELADGKAVEGTPKDMDTTLSSILTCSQKERLTSTSFHQ